MPRQRASSEQHKRAYDLFRDEKGPSAILKTLEDEFEEPVSVRTVATWVKGFRELSKETLILDSPFEWHRMEEYSLPWEASAYVLEMWTFVHENLRWALHLGSPSVRQVRWWWRVHLSARDLGMEDNYWLAERFAIRELEHNVLGLPLEMADLEAHLAYKPWATEERRQAYLRSVEEERIPPLRSIKWRLPLCMMRVTLDDVTIAPYQFLGEFS